MLIEKWNKLPNVWQRLIYKEWMLFIQLKFPIRTFLWDDSYGIDFLLCKSLGIETSNPENDLTMLDKIISNDITKITPKVIEEIFSMHFLVITSEITYLSPIVFFTEVKVLDFHCENESMITDFFPLKRSTRVYVLDYADYQIIDFDKFSNIRDIDNITYVKGYGIPQEMGEVLSLLNYNNNDYE